MARQKTTLAILAVGAFIVMNMIIGIGVAQAAKWLILTSGGVAKTGEELSARVEGELEGEKGTILTEILKIKVEKRCKRATLVGIKLIGEGKITVGGKVKFEGCSVFLNGTESRNCSPHTTGEPEGVIETNKLKGQLLLKEGIGVVRIEPEAGKAFFTLEMKETCPIGERISYIGVLDLKDCENKLETHLVKHLFEEGPGTELWVISETPEHVAHLDGSALAFLSGEHLGLGWGGMPE